MGFGGAGFMRTRPSPINHAAAQTPVSFKGLCVPRDPIPDGCYIARLGPSTKLDFDQGVRINFEAKILGPIGTPPPGFWKGTAYGHLYSSLRCSWRGVGLQAYWGP